MAVAFLAAGKLKENNNPWLIHAAGCEDPDRARGAIEKAAKDVRTFYAGSARISQEQAEIVIAYDIVSKSMRPL